MLYPVELRAHKFILRDLRLLRTHFVRVNSAAVMFVESRGGEGAYPARRALNASLLRFPDLLRPGIAGGVLLFELAC